MFAQGVCLADDKKSFFWEAVRGNFQVEWRWSLADAAAGVVMWSVARTVVAAEVSGVGDWHATQVSADAEDDEPLRVLCTLVVVLSVTERGQGDWLFNRDLLSCAMADEQRLSAPLECHWLSFWDLSEFDFDLSQGEDIGRCAHRRDELVDESLRWVSWCNRGT